jgi:hypothetical protein
MLNKGYLYGSHYLPHDAMATQKSGKTFLTELNEAGLKSCKAVPQTTTSGSASTGFARFCLALPSHPGMRAWP